MTLSRRLARPMLASVFIVGGLDAVRNPEGKVKAAEAVTKPLADAIPGLPNDTELLVKVNGAVQLGAGVMLSLGKFRRLASLALIGSILPTTYAGHRFWEETDAATKAQQRIHFLKNLGLLGGLILALLDTEGAPSLSWRAKRRAHRLSETVGSVVVATGALTHHGDRHGDVAEKTHRLSDATGAKAHAVGATAAAGKGRSAKRARKAAAKSHEASQKAAHQAAVRAAQLADVSNRVAGAGSRAAKGAHDVASKSAHEAVLTAARLTESGGRAARKANRVAAKANKVARQQAHEASRQAARLGESGGRAMKRANVAALRAAKSTAEAAKLAADVAKTAAETAKTTASDAAQNVASGADRAGDVLAKVHDRLPVG